MTYLTEAEAREKWCPFSRFFIEGDAGIFRGMFGNRFRFFGVNKKPVLNPQGTECIGSACACWRWDPRQGYSEYKYKHGGKEENRRGYCGLAGGVK